MLMSILSHREWDVHLQQPPPALSFGSFLSEASMRMGLVPSPFLPLFPFRPILVAPPFGSFSLIMTFAIC
jgi:hypothetical protein